MGLDHPLVQILAVVVAGVQRLLVRRALQLLAEMAAQELQMQLQALPYFMPVVGVAEHRLAVRLVREAQALVEQVVLLILLLVMELLIQVQEVAAVAAQLHLLGLAELGVKE